VKTRQFEPRGPYRAPDFNLPTLNKNARDGVPKTMPFIANLTPAKESDKVVEVELFGIDASRAPLRHRYHVSQETVCQLLFFHSDNLFTHNNLI
jgi:hypothetical protein